VHTDEYFVVEAPDELIARNIAIAAMGGKHAWSSTYVEAEFIPDKAARYPGGEAMRISWLTKQSAADIFETLERITEGWRKP
jgi:hypothetical protein